MSLHVPVGSGLPQSQPEIIMVEHALTYAAQGVPVFPCQPDKSPYIKGGFKAASKDPDQIGRWWARWPDALIGMPTGEPSGMWVLDVDDPATFVAAGIEMPPARLARTGKGFHHYFRYDPAAPVGSYGKDMARPGTDVRGDGGYVILPPSLHPSGRRYEWENSLPPAAPGPNLLEVVLRLKSLPAQPLSPSPALLNAVDVADTALGLRALEYACEGVRAATAGNQEYTLNSMALKMGHLVRDSMLSLSTARDQLVAAGCAMPAYNPREPWRPELIVKKVERALGDGARLPQAALGHDDIQFLNWSELATCTPQRKQFVLPNLAPAGEVTLLTGAGSSGKSLLGQQLATALAAGVQTLGLQLDQGTAMYFTCEDDPQELHWRQHRICRALGVNMSDLDGQLHVASLRGRLDNILMGETTNGQVDLSPTFQRLASLMREKEAKLVVLDNVAHLFGGNENDRSDVTQFVNALNRLAGESGAAILLIAHPNKAGDNYSGSTAWLNAVRSQIFLERDANTDIRTLKLGKANYAPIGEPLRFVWAESTFKLESELAPDDLRALQATIRANAEDEAFLSCLETCTVQRRNVSHQPGSNYAPKIFAAMAGNRGIKEKAFKSAMERLVHCGRIEFDKELWRAGNRHIKRGIRLRPVVEAE
ncbi:RecA-family ATPase [Novosphingobium sp. SG751A]|uniref:AAA family ATPase n=1 Tax=Novosphingobium sp. SG751A TaxID=2587000 RepID=UPI001557464A|nr:AAA family ATPase [Novosphingobium sp. SG751A]NOW45701.1 RecA-family ATPase [Novosphingobium sp. SG751A]